MEHEEQIKIRKGKEFISPELTWDENEREEITRRILDLSDTDIGAFAMILIQFDDHDIPDIVREIRTNGRDAIHLETILSEAESKEKILWWLEYFETGNQKGHG